MSLMPRRSTERIAPEFLPDMAEMEWIGTLKVKSADMLLYNVARTCFTGIRPTDDEAQCALNVLSRPANEHDWKAEVLAVWIMGFAKPDFQFIDWTQHSIINLAFPNETFYKRGADYVGKTTRFVLPMTTLIGGLLPLGMMISFLGLYTFVYFFFVLVATLFGAFAGSIVGVLLTPVVLPFSTMVYRRQEKQIQKAALYTLRRWNDPRFIGEVARASVKADSTMMPQVQETFARLLTQLTPEHYGVMPGGTTESLCRALEVAEERTTSLYWKPDNITTSIPFVKNLLHALKLVGSGYAAKYLRAFLDQNWNAEIKELARNVLVVLTEREKEETARTTLLRHAAVPASADDLLRPAASNTANDDAQTLMRPTI